MNTCCITEISRKIRGRCIETVLYNQNKRDMLAAYPPLLPNSIILNINRIEQLSPAT